MKKYCAALLAVLMIFIMTMPVLASEDGWEPVSEDPSITIVNTSANHTYYAYQIFTGDLARRQRKVPEPNDPSAEPQTYPEYNIKTNDGDVHVYLKGGNYYYVSTGDQYTGNTSAATKVYEQALRSVKWGSGISDDGIIALYHKYVDASKDASGLTPTELREQFSAESVAQKLRGTEETGAVDFANFIIAGGSGKVYLGTADATANGDGGTAELSLSHHGYYLVNETAVNNTVVPDNTSEVIAYSRFIVRVGGKVVVEPKSDVPKVVKKVYDNHLLTGLVGDMSNEDAMIPGFDLDSGSTNAHNLPLVTYPAHPDGTTGGWNDVADYSIGDAVPFKLIGTVPNTYTGYNQYKYIFHDTLSSGYSINPQTIHMYVMNGDNQTMVPMSSAAVIGANVTWNVVTNDDGSTEFTVSIGDTKLIDESGESKADQPSNKLINENSKIVVEYAATLNYKANVGTVGNEDSVYLEFSNNPNPANDITTSKTSRDEVVVFTYMVEGVKIAAQQQNQTNLTLAGAEFKLRREDNKWYRFTEEPDPNHPGEKIQNVTWVKDEGDASIVKSNGSGLFDYKGLDDGLYHLKEVVAPYGYVLPSDEFVFEIHSDIDNTQSYNGTPASIWANGKKVTAATEGTLHSHFSAVVDSNQKVILTVTNSEHSQLPITGGMGVYIFYASGILLMGVAITLLLVKKKKEAK